MGLAILTNKEYNIMADDKPKYKMSGNYLTPFGKIMYRPYLAEKGGFGDNYNMCLGWAVGSAEAKKVRTDITKLNDAAHALAPKQTKKNLPLREVDGMLLLNLDNNYQAPAVKDMNKSELGEGTISTIASGSLVRASTWHKEVDAMSRSGIKLSLKTVQVKELAIFSGGAGDDGLPDDGDDEGYIADDLPSDTGEDATADTPAAEQFA